MESLVVGGQLSRIFILLHPSIFRKGGSSLKTAVHLQLLEQGAVHCHCPEPAELHCPSESESPIGRIGTRVTGGSGSERREPPVCLRMECPVCGQDFPRSVIENHAWNCSGDTGPSEGSGQYQEAGENLECPLCFLSLPPDLIVEHAAFCKGPSCADLPEQGYCSPDKPQEQLTPCFSQEDRKDDSSQIASCITWAFHNYINTKRSEDQRTATCSVEPWSNELKSSDKENVNQLLQCIQKIAVQIDQEPKFNDLLCTLLKSSDPLGILKHLMKEIFKKFQNGSPLALFFILAKLFLPRIVELKSLTVFMKWLEGFICNVVVPWIINEGGWKVLLCALGTLLTSGWLVDLVMLLLRNK